MNNFKYKWNNFKYATASRIQQFMIGRYGIDDMYKGLNIVTWILIVLQFFIHNGILNIFTLLLISYNIFRCFSKNYQKRYNENQKYLTLTKGLRSWINITIRRIRERKNYRFRKCPNCKKYLRLPNQKGKHTVNCPNCHNSFDVKI